ncbi:hypothetical protein Bbelb_430370 [Branchiostoma belcheri]|nr:hypothetical protein Bbelb_430370 [Branchiostoma belcheri]
MQRMPRNTTSSYDTAVASKPNKACLKKVRRKTVSDPGARAEYATGLTLSMANWPSDGEINPARPATATFPTDKEEAGVPRSLPAHSLPGTDGLLYLNLHPLAEYKSLLRNLYNCVGLFLSDLTALPPLPLD